MRIYDVKILNSAEADIEDLADFLFEKLSRESAYHYLDFMRQEVKSLAIYADCFSESRSPKILSVHPRARRMVSHNHKWAFVFHIEGETVFVDRILPSSVI